MGEAAIGLETRHDCLGWATGEACGDCYVCHLVACLRAVHRVLRDDGTVWLNLGDCYGTRAGPGMVPGEGHPGHRWQRTGGSAKPPNRATFMSGGRLKVGSTPSATLPGLKPKDLAGMPWRVALALQADGWFLRSEIIWSKPNPVPEGVKDRPVRAHEYMFLLSKSPRYYYDAVAIREASRHPAQSRNKRTVWEIATRPGHLRGWTELGQVSIAAFPPQLIEPCILAGTSPYGACAACGQAWRREVEQYRTIDGERCGAVPAMRNRSKLAPCSAQGIGHGRTGSVTMTRGWSAACDCRAGVIPCTVLDPFGGTGTVALSALRLGRSAVLIEANRDHARLARQRLADAIPLFTAGS